MTYKKGQDFIVYAGDTSEENRVAYSKNCSIEGKVNTIEVSDPTTGEWRKHIAGKGEWAVNVSGLVAADRNDKKLWDLLASRKGVTLYYKDIVDGQYWAGDAILVELTQTAELRQATTYSAKFQGTGKLDYF